MPFRVRRRSHRDGSRWASLPRCSGGWLALTASPRDLLSFERDLQGLPAPVHPLRESGVLRPFLPRDGPLELVCLLWLPSIRARSRGAFAPGGFPRALVHRLMPGDHPDTSTFPSPGRALARPPVAGFLPLQVAFPTSRRDCSRSGIAAGRSGFPRAGGSAVRRAHRCAPPVGWTGEISGSRLEPPLLPNLLLVRSLSASNRHLRRASTPGKLPSLRRIGANRSVPFRPRGSIPTTAVYSARRFPGCRTWYRSGYARFHPALPPTARRLPGCARCGLARDFPVALPHPSKNPLPTRSRV